MAYKEFGPMLENIATITRLSLFGLRNTMGIILEGEDENIITSNLSPLSFKDIGQV